MTHNEIAKIFRIELTAHNIAFDGWDSIIYKFAENYGDDEETLLEDIRYCIKRHKNLVPVVPVHPTIKRAQEITSQTKMLIEMTIQTNDEVVDTYCECGQYLTKIFMMLGKIANVNFSKTKLVGVPCPAKACNKTYTVEIKPVK